jgi:cytochrome c peroxidase
MLEGKRLFEHETFGGNRRTCQTCHSRRQAPSLGGRREKIRERPERSLFVHDSSDDGFGHGTTRMHATATILLTIKMADNVQLADDPTARTVVLRRSIPTTLNTPAGSCAHAGRPTAT